MTKLNLDRTGKFSPVNYNMHHSSRCGSYDMTEFHYAVTVEGDSGHLNSNGFLIDNNDIQKYFESRYSDGNGRPLPSCEEMVLDAVRGVRCLFGSGEQRNVCVRSVKVEIGGSTGAFIRGEWRVPDWMPSCILLWIERMFPPTVTKF